MCEQTEINYLDGEVVWVKLGSCWWPGEVVAREKLPPDVLPSFRKPPIAVVKFFQEDTYEYVKNINSIYKYNCSRKNEFINKGLYMYRTKHGPMEKFPEDVIRAETAVGGDIEILTRDEFQETKKESYAGLFGEPKKTPISAKRGRGKTRLSESPKVSTPIRKMREKADYKVHILLQGSNTPNSQSTDVSSNPSTSAADLDVMDGTDDKSDSTNAGERELASQTPEKLQDDGKPAPSFSTPTMSSSGMYSCHACSFSTARLNVLILHNKTHSVTFMPYTPSPAKKKPTKASVKSTPSSSKTPKTPRPRKEKSEKPPKKTSQGQKRAGEEPKGNSDVKKPKTEQEIKSSLLADWDDVDEDSNDESPSMVMAGSPEVAVAAESPAVPTPAELPSAQVPTEIISLVEKKSDDLPSTEKPESSSDSKYEFCEDEDWPVEADGGRKIPRVKNPSKRKDETKSISIDDDDMAREIAELLTKTAVPELPAVPEPLKIEENFPEPPIVKSPDKQETKSPERSKPTEKASGTPPTKAIFKTKTFFRSRHSRSQDAIGKYVAEQLNAVERMDMSEADINGSDAVSSPETRESPPVEPIKVARLAPKIQLKKMKAEAAQLREKERYDIGLLPDIPLTASPVLENTTAVHKTDTTSDPQSAIPILDYIAPIDTSESESLKVNSEKASSFNLIQDVLYPTQEIKPVNEPKPEELTLRRAVVTVPENPVNDETKVTTQPNPIEIAVEVTEHFSEPEENIVDKPELLGNELITSDLEIKEANDTKEADVSEEPHTAMNESTASAVDALLSVSREADRVTRVVSDDLPDDLFEDDNRDNGENNINGFSEAVIEENVCDDAHELEENDLQSQDETVEIVQPAEESLFQQPTETVSHQPSEEILRQFSEEIMQQPSEEIPHQPPEESLHQPTGEIIQQPAEGNVQELSEEYVQQGAEDYVQEAAEEIVLDPAEQIDQQSTEEIVQQPAEEILQQPVEEIVQQPAEEILQQPVEEIVQQPAEEIMQPPIEDILLQPTEEHLPEPTEVILHQPTEEILLQPTEEMMQESVNEILQQNTEEVLHENGLILNKNLGSDNLNVESYQSACNAVENINVNLPLEVTSANRELTPNALIENVSESDLQIAEALINLPATAIQKKSNDLPEVSNIPMSLESTVIVAEPQPVSLEADNKVFEPVVKNHTFKLEPLPKSLLKQDSESVNMRFETELEKNENLNAAQSLVQMSESIDHKINVMETSNTLLKTKEIPEKEVVNVKQNNGIDGIVSVEQKVALLSKDNSNEPSNCKPSKFETTSSKLLKILEEPCTPKITRTVPSKHIVMPGKEKILNFDVAKSIFKPNKPKTQSPVIIRRAVNKQTLMNNMSEMTTPDKIILSRSNKQSKDGSSVQTYTIQTAPDAPTDSNTITIIQQKVRKVAKPPTKLQKIKPQNSLISPLIEKKISKESNVVEEAMFDINSMPIVLSDDILTPESIEKMPMLMSDGNLITNTPNPPKLVKTKQPIIEPEKPVISTTSNKPEIKTLLMNPVSEVNKVATPNILSKSSKLRGAKPMLVIDKATGKQKIIMTKADPTAVKEIIKPSPTLIQPVAQNTGKPEKFLILPTASSPRPGRTQKIVIDPQTGKAHVLVSKGPDSALNLNDNKPVSAKLIPSSSDAASPGNTVMIITNAQGAQSRIVLTSEHEKILFPNKQQPNVSQLKTITHRMTTASATSQKTLISTVPQVKTLVNAVPQLKTQTRIIPKQKSAIITSKGQLIVGGRVATTAQNIAPMPEIRPMQKRIVAAEPKKLIQTIQKTSQPILKTSQPIQKIASEPLIFLQQKSGTVVQLTASQFEHFQRTGQIIQKIPVPSQEKTILQKTITISSGEPLGNVVQKQRIRKTITESPTPAKKVKHEIAIAPAQPQPTITPMPALTPLSTTAVTTQGPSISNTVSVTTTPSYSDLENFEEMLPSTAIARQLEPAVMAAEPAAAPPAQLSDGQLLAVPGEHFGGPPGSFYLCVEDSGTLTPIDNRPLVLENNQLVPMAVEPLPVMAQPQPERRDILEAALANSDVFHAEPHRDEAPDFRDLNANVSVHCCVSETSTTLNQPIMTPVEVPSKTLTEPTVPSNLEDGLAVIGVTPHTVPTSLELPITVTDPRIAPKTTDPLRGTNYGPTLLTSPNTEMPYISTEEVDVSKGGPISMPLLTDDDPVGMSMPSLTDDIAVSSVESAGSRQDSPSSLEPEDGQWPRRLLTPGSDSSETSSEIPLQPSIQLSVSEMSRHS